MYFESFSPSTPAVSTVKFIFTRDVINGVTEVGEGSLMDLQEVGKGH